MAFNHGKDSHFSIDSTDGGSLTDVSSFTENVDGLPGEQEFADVTAFGDEGHKNIPGLENASFTASGSWDPTLDAVFGSRPTQTRTFEYGPAGSGTGAVKYTGEAWYTSYTVSSPATGKVTWSASLRVDGVVTRTTFA